VIDGGVSDEYVDYGQRVVGPFLWSRGITRLDAVMVSHSDQDHIGGLIFIVENFRVRTAILGAIATDRLLEQKLLARCAARGTEVLRVKRGDTIHIGNLNLPVLNPEANHEARKNVNNDSVVVKVPFGPKTFLFTGDIEKDAEATLDASTLDADVLKVPHH